MGNRLHIGPCGCPEWEEGIKQLDGLIIYASNHPAAPQFNSPSFKYCPWCGYRRQVDKAYSEKYDSYFNPATRKWLEEYSMWWEKKNGPRPKDARDEQIPEE